MNYDARKSSLIRMSTIAISILVCVFSLIVLKPILSSVDIYKHEIDQLDNKGSNVMALVTASSITSALISAIPDDTATPIANQLAEFSKLFIIIMAVLLAEKYLLTVFGTISSIMLFFSCVATIIYNLGYNKQWLYNTIIKILILALACGTFIPVSIKITDMIEDTFGETINSAINDALDSEEQLKSDKEPAAVGDKNILQKFTGFFGNIGDTVSDAVSSVATLIETAKTALRNFVEAIAIMFVTSCIIPVMTLILYIAVIKYVFGLNFMVSDIVRKAYYRKSHYRIKDNSRLSE